MKLGAEDKAQLQILEYLEGVLPHALVWHTPNSGRRSISEAVRFKRLGVLAGVPDLAILPGDGRIYFLEVKSAKGTTSPEQKAFGKAAQERGAGWAVVKSLDDVRTALREWRIPTREAA